MRASPVSMVAAELLKRTKLLKPPAGSSTTSASSGAGGFGSSSSGGFASSSSGGYGSSSGGFDRKFGSSGGFDAGSSSGFWGGFGSSSGGFGSNGEFDSGRFGSGMYATDDGTSTTSGGPGYAADSEDSEDPDDGPAPVSMTSLSEDELADASDRYRDTVYVRNLWEAYVRRESWEPPSRVRLRRDLSQWTEPREMLREFERAQIPKIRACRASRRHGWRQFLLGTPTLRSGLQHHAKWGPELDKQVQGVLDLRLVADERALWSAYHDKHDKLYRQPPKSECHFNVGPLSRQQVAALQCLGEYRRLLYVAVDESGGPDSFLGRDVYPCVCAYCLAAGPNRSLVYRNQKVPS